MAHTISRTLNGIRYAGEVEPRLLLVNYLHDVQSLTGTQVGCDTSQCDGCTVLVDGQAVRSCAAVAVQADGAIIATIAGLAQNGTLHPLQQGFRAEHGLQCAFCTPGMIVTPHQFLKENPHPTDDEIRHALAGKICRCTKYRNIVRAAQFAASKFSGEPVISLTAVSPGA